MNVMWRRKKKVVRSKRLWLGKAQSILRSFAIKASIWLSVKTARLSPLRLKVIFMGSALLFIVYNCWHIVEGVRIAHNKQAPAVIEVAPINRDTIAHITPVNTALADSIEFGLYLDSLNRQNLLDSIYSARPGLRDTIAMIKQHYHIK